MVPSARSGSAKVSPKLKAAMSAPGPIDPSLTVSVVRSARAPTPTRQLAGVEVPAPMLSKFSKWQLTTLDRTDWAEAAVQPAKAGSKAAKTTAGFGKIGWKFTMNPSGIWFDS